MCFDLYIQYKLKQGRRPRMNTKIEEAQEEFNSILQPKSTVNIVMVVGS